MNAWINDEMADYLSQAECEELYFVDFLMEFSGAFAQLGTDLSLLRTKEDFENFDFGSLKQFMDSDVFGMLNEEGFYMDTSCLLGLVEVDTSVPPLFYPKDLLDWFKDCGKNKYSIVQWSLRYRGTFKPEKVPR